MAGFNGVARRGSDEEAPAREMDVGRKSINEQARGRTFLASFARYMAQVEISLDERAMLNQRRH
jgi:hypothetical protein